jgi:AraC-like DNA-binding protein
MTDSNPHDHTLPAAHVLHLLELVGRWNVAEADLLAGFQLARDRLAEPGARLSIATIGGLIERARELTGEPALGVYLGAQMRISWHGFLGFAAMSASTVRESIELAVRFAPTRTSVLGLRLREDGEQAALVIDELVDLGPSRDAIVLSLVIGIWQIGNALTGQSLTGHAELAMPRPAYFDRFANVVAGRAEFARPAHQLVFPREALELPLVMADAGALELARAQCDRELESLARESSLVARVRALVREGPDAVGTVEQLAQRWGMSVRTLKRKLAAHDTSFSELVTAQRREVSMQLLRGGASVEKIADRLGYSDAQNFSRAFRRWTGVTPSAYRKSLGTAD